jgi:hypothetical protein
MADGLKSLGSIPKRFTQGKRLEVVKEKVEKIGGQQFTMGNTDDGQHLTMGNTHDEQHSTTGST